MHMCVTVVSHSGGEVFQPADAEGDVPQPPLSRHACCQDLLLPRTRIRTHRPTRQSQEVRTLTSVSLTDHRNNNNSNFFCANILENQAQWCDKTRGLINLIIESNA